MLGLFGIASFAGCGGASAGGRGCGWEGWSGSCELQSVNKIREIEFPVPQVVLEGIYNPISEPGQQGSAPPTVRQQFKVLANQEFQMRDHLMKNGKVHCQMQASANEPCTAPRVALDIPPLMPSSTDSDVAAPTVVGCAQLERSPDGKPPPAPVPAAQLGIPEEFFFEHNSVDVNAQLIEQAKKVGQILKNNPGIECLGIVGSVTYGESPSLAAERGKTIQNMVLGEGVDPKRVTVYTATVRVYGAGASLPEADPKERKVHLRVMIYKPQGAPPQSAPPPGG